MSSSIGRMTSYILWNIEAMFETTNQLLILRSRILHLRKLLQPAARCRMQHQQLRNQLILGPAQRLTMKMVEFIRENLSKKSGKMGWTWDFTEVWPVENVGWTRKIYRINVIINYDALGIYSWGSWDFMGIHQLLGGSSGSCNRGLSSGTTPQPGRDDIVGKSYPMTDPWCCYILCSMDPINIPQSY